MTRRWRTARPSAPATPRSLPYSRGRSVPARARTQSSASHRRRCRRRSESWTCGGSGQNLARQTTSRSGPVGAGRTNISRPGVCCSWTTSLSEVPGPTSDSFANAQLRTSRASVRSAPTKAAGCARTAVCGRGSTVVAVDHRAVLRRAPARPDVGWHDQPPARGLDPVAVGGGRHVLLRRPDLVGDILRRAPSLHARIRQEEARGAVGPPCGVCGGVGGSRRRCRWSAAATCPSARSSGSPGSSGRRAPRSARSS